MSQYSKNDTVPSSSAASGSTLSTDPPDDNISSTHPIVATDDRGSSEAATSTVSPSTDTCGIVYCYLGDEQSLVLRNLSLILPGASRLQTIAAVYRSGMILGDNSLRRKDAEYHRHLSAAEALQSDIENRAIYSLQGVLPRWCNFVAGNTDSEWKKQLEKDFAAIHEEFRASAKSLQPERGSVKLVG